MGNLPTFALQPEIPENRRQLLRQILGNQPRSELAGAFDVEPGGGLRSLHRREADGVYFSSMDGPGTGEFPETDIVTNTNMDYNTPTIVNEYDDLLRFGGG